MATSPFKKPMVVFQEPILRAQELLGDDFDGLLVPIVFEFIGESIREEVIASAIESIVHRHEAFRSSYFLDDSGSWTVVVAPEEESSSLAKIHVIRDVKNGSAAEEAISNFFNSWSPADLLQEPVVRFGLIQLSGDGSHKNPPLSLLLLLVHHVAFDASSHAVIVRELQRALNSSVETTHPPSSYFSFKNDLSNYKGINWKTKLQRVNPSVSFPSDKQANAKSEYSASRLQFTLPQELSASLSKFCTENSSSRFAVLMAAFQVLLHRFNVEEKDFTVGTPISCRFIDKDKWNNSIGCFVDMAPIIAHIENGSTFNELIANCEESLKEIRSNLGLLSSKVSDVLPYQGGLQPWFRTVVQWLDFSRFDVKFSETLKLTSRIRYDMLKTVMFDMVTNFWFMGWENITVEVLYRDQLFSQEMVASLFDSFVTLLNGLLASPSSPVSKAPLLSTSQEKICQDVLTGLADECTFKSVSEAFEAVVDKYPNAIAISDSNGTLWTYSKLQLLSSALQIRMPEHLTRSENPLFGILIDRSPLLILALLAINRAGAGYVIIDPTLPVKRQEYIVNTTACQAILTVEKYASTSLASLTPIILIDIPTLEEDLLTLTRKGTISYQPITAINYVAFTSGTTGIPKPAAISHRSILLRFCGAHRWTQIGPGDVQSSLSNISFDGFAFEWHSALLNGATLHILSNDEALSPLSFAQICQSRDITHSFLPTALFHTFVALQPNCFAGLKFIAVGGEALHKEAVEALFNALEKLPEHGIMDLYGPAETAVACTAHIIKDIDLHCRRYRSMPIGIALPNVTMSIVDTQGIPVPPGVTGELLVGGLSVADGRYLGLAEINKEAWIDKPCGKMYRTGDLVQLSPTGALLYFGRIDKQIKIRSFRVDLGEIEHTIASFPGIAQVVVSSRNSTLIGFVVVSSNIKPQDIISYLEMRLPQQLIPTNIVIVEKIPLTPNGKVDYSALPWPQRDIMHHSSTPENYDSKTEQILAEIECSVLGISSIPKDANFFSLGGDSITAIVIASKAKKAGINIRSADVIMHPTLESLARSINSSSYIQQSLCQHDSASPAQQCKVHIPLTPTQKWCISLGWEKINDFTQALLFKLPDFTSITQAQQAFAAVIAAHPGLRVAYSAPSGAFYANTTVPFDSMTEITIIDHISIAERAYALASKLDIEQGPLINAELINGPHGQQAMLFCASHLVVDTVSWYVIKNNFLEALDGISLSQQNSWLELSKQLASPQVIEYFVSSESSYWKIIDSAKWAIAALLPIQSKEVVNTIQSSQTISQKGIFELQNQSQMFEITLAALGLAICGEDLFYRGLLVCIESNGRQPICPLISSDFSEAVGWFTTMYPFLIGGTGGNIANLADSIVSEISKVPHKGIGYGVIRYNAVGDINKQLASLPEPQISFNFFGKSPSSLAINLSPEFINQSDCLDQIFVPARPVGRRPFLIEVICQQNDNQIEIAIEYASTVFSEATIKEVINKFFTALDAICKTKDRLSSYPATPMQEGMIFHSQSEPKSLVYRCQAIYSITSDESLDIEKLERAWEATVSIYSVVTNKFYWKSGVLLQEPQLHYALPWKITHSRDDFYKKAEQSLQEIDVLNGKTFEVIVDIDAKLMAVTFHHAILDGWSLALMIKYLVNEYRQSNYDNTNKVPQFREYVMWLEAQNAQLRTTSEEFWRMELANVQPTMIAPLLSLQPHESVMPISEGRRTERQTFSDKLSKAVAACAKELCVSRFVIYHAAWLSVLSRFLGTSDIVIGVTVSGRMYSDFPGIESLVGLCINTMPHRIIIDQNENTTHLIQRIHSHLQKLFIHSHVPLTTLNSLSGLSHGDQLFDSIIVFENYPMPTQEEGFSLILKQIKEQTNFPLSLCVDDNGVAVHYNGEKIGGCSARLVLRCFLMALEQISSFKRDTMSVGDITLITEKEHKLLILEETINRGVSDTDHLTLCSIVEKQALLFPNAVAILDEEKSYTYKQIIDNARDIANALVSEFSKPGCSRFVAICIKRSHRLISSILGVHMAGGAFVLVDQSLPSRRITDMLDETQCCAILTLSNNVSSILQSFDIPLIFVDVLTGLAKIGLPESYLEISHVVYTSGSSGKPKGVIITHQNMVSRLASKTNNLEPAWLNIGPEDVVANLCSPSFDVYFSEVFHALIHGASIAIIPEQIVLSPRDTAMAFSKMGVTHVFMPTALFHALAATCPEVFIPLKHIHVGGEVLQLPLLRKVISTCGNHLPSLGFVNGYGPTETTIGSHRYIIRDVKQVESLSSIPIGHPCPMTLQYIVDTTGKLAPVGMVGELLLGGDCVSPGYIGDAELTIKKFTNNVFSKQKNQKKSRLYHTGDLVRRTETGDIEFFGRIDNQVKVRGHRIEIEEVETALLACNGITSSAVTITDNNTLIAFVVPDTGVQLSYIEIVEQLQELLPKYMIPTKFAVVSSIPTTTGGKVDKIALLKNGSLTQLLTSTTTSLKGNKTPETPLEVSMAKIWTKVLGITEINRDTNFFELGGDSILAMRAARYAEEEGINTSVHDIFGYPVLSELVEIIAAKETFAAEPTIKQDIKQDILQTTPIVNRSQISAGIISIAVAVPEKRFRIDKLAELITFLGSCSFSPEYIQYINDTGKCPGTLLGNDWYTNQSWFPKWLETVPKIKTDPFDGLETRARFPFDPRSLKETCNPFPMLCSDASTLAGAAAMVYAGINPLDIDGFIDCAIPQDNGTDTNYLMVHKKLGLNNAAPLSLFTACTSFISAVEAATAYVCAGHRKCVLVCATQIGSHISDPTSAVGCKLADGSAAAIISKVQPGQGYQGSHGSALGEFCGAMDLSLKFPYMHLESPRSLNLCSYLHPGDMTLYDKTFGESLREMVAVCRIALQKSRITDTSQVFLAPHQPNSELPLLWARELGIKRMHFSWKKYGSMGPVCPAVNLFQAIEQGELCAGELAMFAAPGISMNYYALVECITNELVHAITGN